MDVDSRGIKWFKKTYKPCRLIKILDKWQKALEVPANYLENHDQIRSVNHFGNTGKYWEQSAKLLCGLNLCLKGVPFIYEGEEIGMREARKHSAWYFKGMKGAAALRRKAGTLKTFDDLIDLCRLASES